MSKVEKNIEKSAVETKSPKISKKIQEKVKLEALKKTQAGVFGGFFEFLQKYSVFGLAIGLVIGDSSKAVVNSLVAGLINPFIGLFLPNNQSLKDWKILFNNQQFLVGDILFQTINFVIILFLIYFVIKVLLRKDDILEKK